MLNNIIATAIPDCEGYFVDAAGNVYSQRGRDGVLRLKITRTNHNGYQTVCFSINGVKKTHLVSRLVLIAFAGPPPAARPNACHGDGVKSNNSLGNLRWGSHEENEDDKRRHGTYNNSRPNIRLTSRDVLTIKERLGKGEPAIRLAQEFNVSYNCIYDIKSGTTWRKA